MVIIDMTLLLSLNCASRKTWSHSFPSSRSTTPAGGCDGCAYLRQCWVLLALARRHDLGSHFRECAGVVLALLPLNASNQLIKGVDIVT